MTPAPPKAATLPRRPLPRWQTVAAWAVMLGLLVAGIWSTGELRINAATFVDGWRNATDFVQRIFPLDFPPFIEIVTMTMQTLAIVTVATVLSVLISVPLALFAAKTTTTGRFARGASRTVIVIARAIPDLVFAIILFRVFGLGTLPGILALAFHSVGMVGKLYADAIEQLDAGPNEALRAAGGWRMQRVVASVLPPLMPQIIATALHRFDINLRTSVLLGYVGVSGIGLEISNALRVLDYQRGMALALIVLLLCVATELVSGAIRRRLLGHGDVGGLMGLIDARLRARHGVRSADGRVRLTPPWDGERIRRWASIALTVAVIVGATVASDIDWENLLADILRIPHAVGLFLPPEVDDADLLGMFFEQLLVTIQIGLAATFLGMLLAVPIGILAARNVFANRVVTTVFRVVIVVVRGLPELIIAIIFIVITGLGPAPGALALAIGSIGLLAKLVADSIEETDIRVQTAIESLGATRPQIFVAATLRQSVPAFVVHVLYQLDVNIRSATLLGIVGAGGIGYYLLNAARVQEFGTVTTIVLLILGVVLALEGLAVWIAKVVR